MEKKDYYNTLVVVGVKIEKKMETPSRTISILPLKILKII